ncbi:bis(5'-nucleosyl)-tetraphosphatase PrpE [Aquibacillus rhizosphaerae]|uniref:Bis(5'-nucleosyl)-tetraphosphatase PrpE n=1 Tax=Aquibacillus rhizosphaerae TaxID=3051431 RepID=A0ABT7LAP4_9BACI|nr:bis(5'-nucleosyl)-tetraphosphatase PrpE [Aquibacillus sp. LR5S19]MDL4842939.1 bis(5'-nucleosyl)-tetraphosphatase PrpE [Aquibacillus sp. LR5S19]
MKVDIIGDVHGCIDELYELFDKLNYEWENGVPQHPDNRIPVFVGDLTDRGPNSIAVIDLVYTMVMDKSIAKYVPGNHCNKLYRYFLGNNVKEQHGLETTVSEFKKLNQKRQKQVRYRFISLYENAAIYIELPEVNTIVAHAGIREDLIGKNNKKVKTFVFYGDITGETHLDGRPVRRDWAQNYQGERWIVYGHTPVKEPRIVNKTINIDTGCVFGNALSAFRLPEERAVSVPSKQPLVEEKFNYFDS